MQIQGVTFDLGSARIFLITHVGHIYPVKVKWISATDYYYYVYFFYLFVLFLLTALLQIINRSNTRFYNFITFSLQINAVIMLFQCLIFIICLYIYFLFVTCYSCPCCTPT